EHGHLEILCDRVGEELTAHRNGLLASRLRIIRIQLETHEPTNVDLFHTGKAESAQCSMNRLALGIEDAPSWNHADFDLICHHASFIWENAACACESVAAARWNRTRDPGAP